MTNLQNNTVNPTDTLNTVTDKKEDTTMTTAPMTHKYALNYIDKSGKKVTKLFYNKVKLAIDYNFAKNAGLPVYVIDEEKHILCKANIAPKPEAEAAIEPPVSEYAVILPAEDVAPVEPVSVMTVYFNDNGWFKCEYTDRDEANKVFSEHKNAGHHTVALLNGKKMLEVNKPQPAPTEQPVVTETPAEPVEAETPAPNAMDELRQQTEEHAKDFPTTPSVVQLKDGTTSIVLSPDDLIRIIEENMGSEVGSVLRDYMKK